MTIRGNRLTPTTKSVDDLYQLFKDGRLDLNPDYQRNSVWPPKARAFLVDTILMDRPIPMLFLYKYRDVNANRMNYRVIDGQQRLRAAFSYLENRFSATESKSENIAGKRFKKLFPDDQGQFMSYSFVVMELLGFNEEELRDIFARINRYVVRLSPQELRDAEHPGPFKDYVDIVSADPIWNEVGIFSATHKNRKRDKEFIAELTILMLEGPQDKKGSVDLYFSASSDQFEEAETIRDDLLKNVKTARNIISGNRSIYHKHPGFYALLGALFNLTDDDDDQRKKIEESTAVKESLKDFSKSVESLPADFSEASELAKENNEIFPAYQYLRATSRQTDNVRPRTQAIQVLQGVIEQSLKRDFCRG